MPASSFPTFKKSAPEGVWLPDREELQAAAGRSLPDLIAPDLRILFCGVNPGLYSAAVQRHFARPGNRFWPALHAAGFTTRLLSPWESHELLAAGMGVTSLVARASAAAREISPSELVAGGQQLISKVQQYRPEWLAVLGIGAYRTAFGDRSASPGLQGGRLAGARVWLLPSPSGANGSYPLAALIQQFQAFQQASSSKK
jgi:TDG/mug DNA glycosylase family protein